MRLLATSWACNTILTSRRTFSHIALHSSRHFALAAPLASSTFVSTPYRLSNSRPFSRMSIFDASTPDLSDAPSTILLYTEDKYDGVIVDSKKLPENDADFTVAIDSSLAYWREHKRRGIWLKVPLEKASFVPILSQRGFVFHHAEKDYVMMTNWLAPNASRLPANASHQVGVGCVVVNDEGKLLLVQEKNGPLRGTGIWKMPTGVLDLGEDIAQGAVREVHEETGIEADFVKIMCFRQAHNVLFGKSDLFFVCVLRPRTTKITIQEVELIAADWCDPETLFQQALFQSSPLWVMVNDMIREELRVASASTSPSREGYPGMAAKSLPIGYRRGEHVLYYHEDHYKAAARTAEALGVNVQAAATNATPPAFSSSSGSTVEDAKR